MMTATKLPSGAEVVLLPCPWCGGSPEARFLSQEDDGVAFFDGLEGFIAIECSSDGEMPHWCSSPSSVWGELEDDAVRLWQTRRGEFYIPGKCDVRLAGPEDSLPAGCIDVAKMLHAVAKDADLNVKAPEIVGHRSVRNDGLQCVTFWANGTVSIQHGRRRKIFQTVADLESYLEPRNREVMR